MIATAEALASANVYEQVTAVCAVVGLGALILGLVSLYHSRSANFVAAWATLRESMQRDEVRGGRAILTVLQVDSPIEDPKDEAWHNAFNRLGPPFEQSAWYRKLLDVCPDQRVQLLRQWARAAYDEMDLAGILVCHSRIPGLLLAFVAEYEDGIIKCFENGKFLLAQRIKQKRHELYECFCVLYAAALECRDRRPELYPHLTLEDWAWPQWSVSQFAQRAHDELASVKRHVEEHTEADGGA